jgi:acyl carrier protein
MIQQARALTALAHNEQTKANALVLLDQAAEKLDNPTVDDLYTRLLLTGSDFLRKEGYRQHRANVLNALGLYRRALSELQHIQKGVVVSETNPRNQVWVHLVESKAFIGLEEYQQATQKLQEAPVTCSSIQSAQNMVSIANKCSQLLRSPYGSSSDVIELADRLHEWYGIALPEKELVFLLEKTAQIDFPRASHIEQSALQQALRREMGYQAGHDWGKEGIMKLHAPLSLPFSQHTRLV